MKHELGGRVGAPATEGVVDVAALSGPDGLRSLRDEGPHCLCTQIHGEVSFPPGRSATIKNGAVVLPDGSRCEFGNGSLEHFNVWVASLSGAASSAKPEPPPIIRRNSGADFMVPLWPWALAICILILTVEFAVWLHG